MEKPVNRFSNAIKTDHIELTYSPNFLGESLGTAFYRCLGAAKPRYPYPAYVDWTQGYRPIN